jgi:hypothetical protein
VAFVHVIARSVNGIQLDSDFILIISTLLFLPPALVITRNHSGAGRAASLLRPMVHFQIQCRWYLLPLVVLPAATLASTLSVPPDGLSAQVLVIAYLTAYLPALLGLVYPTLLAAIGDVAHPIWRARAVGVYRLWRDVGFAAGALLAGLIADL